MDTTQDADRELLGAAARRHLATLDPLTSVHMSAAVDALTDPLVPPRMSGVDDAATADLAEVLRAVRGRLLHAAQQAGDVQRTIALALAARELTHALATLTPEPPGSTGSQHPAAAIFDGNNVGDGLGHNGDGGAGAGADDVPSHHAGPARPGWPGR